MNEILDNKQIVLVSSSPRRKELIENAGFNIKVEQFPFEEIIPVNLRIDETALYLAEKKADQLPIGFGKDRIVITADTIVVANKKILGKPRDKTEAQKMLQCLSGLTHFVETGVCIKFGNKKKSFMSSTEVKFAELTNNEIEYYIENYQPYDKAGAYGIQEWIGYIGVEKISGSYYNLMGLPIQKLYAELKLILKAK